jgi:hypothetical protein
MEQNVDNVLVRGVNCFTESDLFMRAATLKGLEMQNVGSRSQKLKEYKVGLPVLAKLAEENIVRRVRPERDETYALVDDNPQDSMPEYTPSNSWNFSRSNNKKKKFDLRLSLSIELQLSIRERGIIFFPTVSATLRSPSSRLSNRWAFNALVDYDDSNLPDIAKQLAVSQEGRILVSWTEMGLGGLRQMIDLFLEVAKHKEDVFALGQAKESIFYPAPIAHKGDSLFVAETIQPSIFKAWEKQLKKYRESLFFGLS